MVNEIEPCVLDVYVVNLLNVKMRSTHRINSFQRQIITFTQKVGETIYQC